MTVTTSCHRVDHLVFDKDEMIITVDNKTLRFPLRGLSNRLLHATPRQRQHFEISASGYGIHWPEIDEDLSVEGLLRSWEAAQ